MKQMLFHSSERAKNIGLLVLRVGIGVIFIMHGFPKLLAGTQRWIWLGTQMQHLGITFAPIFWGFMAACAEFFGGLFLIVGFGTRIAAFFLSCVMIVATVFHLAQGDPFTKYSHPLSLLVVFLALMIMGAGAYSMDASQKK